MTAGMPDPLTLVALIVAFGVAPFVALMITSYTKLVIVFGLLRTAMGLQQTPPNMVLNGIAIILTIYIMAPVGMDVGDALRGRTLGAKGEGLNDIMAVFDAASGSSSSSRPPASGRRRAPSGCWPTTSWCWCPASRSAS